MKRKAISLNHTKQAALRVEVVFRGGSCGMRVLRGSDRIDRFPHQAPSLDALGNAAGRMSVFPYNPLRSATDSCLASPADRPIGS